MKKSEDLTGKRYGKLTVIGKNQNSRAQWDCVCDCGNKITLMRSRLTRLHSCGCLLPKEPQLIGERFGRLVVVARAPDIIKSNRKVIRWECQCDCGNRSIVIHNNLIRGNTKSCGCIAKEVSKMMLKRYNRYDLSGEYGVGYTHKNEPFYFDLEDYDKIKGYCWSLDCHGYVATRLNHRKERIVMSRLIMDCPKNLFVDHIKGNSSLNDNRKENLRIVNVSQNGMNRKCSKTNTTGVTGISYEKKSGKYKAQIQANHKAIYLGTFQTLEEATRVRKEAEEKYFKEYSYDNSQKM